MERKKIIYVWKSPYPWDVRVEKICKSLSKEYEVLILARWGNEAKKAEQIDGITVRRVGFREKSIKSIPLSFNRTWKKELETVIKGYKPDAIIVREIMLGTLVGKLGKKHNIPTIMDMAENYPALMKLWRKYNNTLLKKFAMRVLNIPRLVEKSSISYMSAIIVVCKEQIQRLNSNYKYPQNKIRVIKNTPYLVPEKQESNNNHNKIVFLHHGWLTEEKRIDNFINAFVTQYGNNENYQLNIAGAGNCLSEYQVLAKGIKNIAFLGEYNHQELDAIISESTIGIMPYEVNDFNEFTIHNKLFDYYANSKPVIVSEVKPISRIVSETNSGYIVDCSSSDSIINFFKKQDYKDLNTFSTNAYKAYEERYNWSIDEKALLQFVKEVI